MINELNLAQNPLSGAHLANINALKANVAAASGKEAKNAAAMKAAKEFESSFLTAMLEQMWTGIEAESPFGGGHAEKVYRSMMVGEYAKSISASGGIGLADHVYREILSAQEGQR